MVVADLWELFEVGLIVDFGEALRRTAASTASSAVTFAGSELMLHKLLFVSKRIRT